MQAPSAWCRGRDALTNDFLHTCKCSILKGNSYWFQSFSCVVSQDNPSAHEAHVGVAYSAPLHPNTPRPVLEKKHLTRMLTAEAPTPSTSPAEIRSPSHKGKNSRWLDSNWQFKWNINFHIANIDFAFLLWSAYSTDHEMAAPYTLTGFGSLLEKRNLIV